MTIGDKIRLLRTGQKVSIRKLSDMTGLSKSTLSDLENNISKKPTVDTIGRIAKALDIPISELFEETPTQVEKTNLSDKEATENERTNQSPVFLRSVARAKKQPKDVQERIAAFIDLVLNQEEDNDNK